MPRLQRAGLQNRRQLGSAFPENMQHLPERHGAVPDGAAHQATTFVRELDAIVLEMHVSHMGCDAAGEIKRRLADLVAAFTDDEVKAIVCARGGAGAGWLLPRLDPELARRHPKPFIGYSDLTFVHLMLNRLEQVSFHGPMVAWELALDRFDEPSWRAALPAVCGASSPAPICLRSWSSPAFRRSSHRIRSPGIARPTVWRRFNGHCRRMPPLRGSMRCVKKKTRCRYSP